MGRVPVVLLALLAPWGCGKSDDGTASDTTTSDATASDSFADGGERGDSECYYRERVTLTREDYESWAMGTPTPIDDPGTTGDPSEPTTGAGSTTDAGTSGTGGAVLDEQQVCQMVCAEVTPNDPYAGGLAQCQVDGAMGTGAVTIDCYFSIGCA